MRARSRDMWWGTAIEAPDAVAEAVALGARVAGFQPQASVRVLLDPAGHPFCLCRDAGG